MKKSATPEEITEKMEEITPVEETTEILAEEVDVVNEDETNETEDGGIKSKDQYKGKILKLSLAGALVDIGTETPAVIHITQIARPEGNDATNNIHDLLKIGQEVDVWVKKVKDGRIELTMIKPFDLEWREIKKDMVVKGTVIRLEKFGVFVEIGAERPGLIHISELAHSYVRQPSDMLKEGDEIESQVLEVNRRKKQIKLSIKAMQPEPVVDESAPVAPRPVSARAQQLKDGITQDNRDKTPRRPKKSTKKRAELNSEGVTMLFTDETQTGDEETAMGIALKEAMEKAKARIKTDKKKSTVSSTQEDILSRTLNTKAG